MKNILISSRGVIALLCFSLFFFMIVLGLNHIGIIQSKETNKNEPTQWQAPDLPNLNLTSIKGNSFNLRQLKADIIIINFWASWCAPCIHEFPLLLETTLDNKTDIIMVAISNDNNKDDMQSFVELFPKAQNNPAKIKIVWDSQLKIAEKYFNVVILPETLIVNRNYQITNKIVGEVKKEELLQKIAHINKLN